MKGTTVPLYLNDADVATLVDMKDALAAVDEAMRLLGRDGTVNEPRRRMPLPKSSLQMMAGCMPTRGVYGQRMYASSRQTRTSKFNRLVLYSSADQSWLALIDCERISKLRTGAASAVAASYLARPDADTVGLIGTGRHARLQLQAFAASRPLSRVRVFSRDAERRSEFARRMEAELGVPVEAVATAQECVSGMSQVIAATKSATPVFDGAWLSPGTHVTTMGANAPDRREVDDETVLKSAVVTVDDPAQARIEAGEFIDLVRDGRLAWDRVAALSDVVQGIRPGRTSPEQITLFKSLGLGLEDVALGMIAYERAVARGIGRQIEL